MTKMRRFPTDETEQDDPEQEAPQRTRRRPADKRWKRPVSDKSHAPASGHPQGDIPDGDDR